MSRAWRIEYEGALYHLLSRGNERSDIFVDDYDRKGFLDAIEEMSERFEIDVFAIFWWAITIYVEFYINFSTDSQSVFQ